MPETAPCTLPPVDGQALRAALGSYPTGVTFITSVDRQGCPVGMVVGTFTSVSLDPPLVGFLPTKSSHSWQRIAETGRFGVNVMPDDTDVLDRILANPPEDRFAGIDFSIGDTGTVRITDCAIFFDCLVDAVVEAGDHWFVTARILALERQRHTRPLIFFEKAFHRLAIG